MIKCNALEEVREGINSIDEQIVQLIALRGEFVKQAARFKHDGDAVKAPKRVEEVIENVKIIARLNGANEEVVESIYRAMIASFIKVEMEEFSSRK